LAAEFSKKNKDGWKRVGEKNIVGDRDIGSRGNKWGKTFIHTYTTHGDGEPAKKLGKIGKSRGSERATGEEEEGRQSRGRHRRLRPLGGSRGESILLGGKWDEWMDE
jgi:hypothetical protein